MALYALLLCEGGFLMVALLFVGRGALSSVFQASYLFTTEIYPVSIRSSGLGTCRSMTTIGCMVSPFVAQLALRVAPFTAVITYGLTALVGAALVLSQPREKCTAGTLCARYAIT